MYYPIALIVLSNILYNVCSKSTPEKLNPFATLTITYVIGAVFSALLYFILNRGGHLLQEYRHLNWSSIVLGLAIVGLEAGSIYMYKAGWDISIGHLVHSAVLAVFLLVIGVVFYRETVTVNRIAGIAVCLLGLYLMNQ